MVILCSVWYGIYIALADQDCYSSLDDLYGHQSTLECHLHSQTSHISFLLVQFYLDEQCLGSKICARWHYFCQNLLALHLAIYCLLMVISVSILCTCLNTVEKFESESGFGAFTRSPPCSWHRMHKAKLSNVNMLGRIHGYFQHWLFTI